MFSNKRAPLLLGCIFTLMVSGLVFGLTSAFAARPALAQQADQADIAATSVSNPKPKLKLNPDQNPDPNSEWNRWLVRQIENHPQILAAREQMNARLSSSEANTRPLYNPELETEFEHTDESNNYRIGISQTMDMWGKRGERIQEAEHQEIAARQAYRQSYNNKLSNALRALVTWEAEGQRYQLAVEQERQLDTLIALVKQRQQAGDLGQIDVELSLLSLSQRLNDSAATMAAFQVAEANLRELLPGWQPGQGLSGTGSTGTGTGLKGTGTKGTTSVPDNFWSALDIPTFSPQTSPLIDNHPKVLVAKAEWQIQQQQMELARLEAKAEPTLGINAGREEDESIVGLTLSIPLNVRNNYGADIRAARQQNLSAEANYRAVRRQQQFSLQAAIAVAQQYQRQIKRWQSLMNQSEGHSKRLLEQQWRAGDLSTNEYLTSLQQRMEGMMAGISLNQQYRLAVIEWLNTSGLVSARFPQTLPY